MAPFFISKGELYVIFANKKNCVFLIFYLYPQNHAL